MKTFSTTTIVRRVWGKSPVFRQIETARRFCLTACFWGTNLRGGHPKHEPDRAFRNLAPCAAVIRGWRANPGLYSSHAVEVLWPRLPATSPFLSAVSSLAGRLNSLGCPSQPGTVMQGRLKNVFTQTHKRRRNVTFSPLQSRLKNVKTSLR
jgi:hypothetical protein